MGDPARHLPSNVPTPVLAYQGAAPAAAQFGIVYERTGDTLTITIPPRPLVAQVLIRTLAFLLCAIPTAGILALALDSARDGWKTPTTPLCVAPIGLLFAWATVRAFSRLIRCTQEGRQLSVLHASPAGLEIFASDNVPPFDLQLPRDRIVTVDAHPGGTGSNLRLILRITTVDDTLYLANLPWCAGYPMAEVEDRLRDVLRLSSTH